MNIWICSVSGILFAGQMNCIYDHTLRRLYAILYIYIVEISGQELEWPLLINSHVGILRFYTVV